MCLKYSVAAIGLLLGTLTFDVSAANFSSKAHVFVGGQLCGVGSSPNCATNELFSKFQGTTEYTGDLSVVHSATSGATSSGTVVVSGEADMASGKIRIVNSATDIEAGTSNLQAAYAMGFVGASLGDTFKLYNNDGTPYIGTGSSKLSLGIDGLLEGTNDSGFSLNISIGIFKPGSFDAYAAGDYDAWSALQIGYTSTGYLSAESQLPSELSLQFNVDPGSSFEWLVQVASDFAFRQDNDESIFVNLDLGHTIALNFEGPANTYVASASGLFPGSVPMAPVPLPASFSFLSLGLVSLLGVARRRTSLA